MVNPQFITIPILHAGYTIELSWTPVDGAASYVVERRFNHLFSDQDIFDWDTFDGYWQGKTYDDFDLDWKDSTWDAFDLKPAEYTIYRGTETACSDVISETALYAVYRVRAVDLEGGVSAWTVSDPREIIPNRAPVISGSNTDLGTKYSGFSIGYSVTDPEPSDTVSVQVFLDDVMIQNHNNFQQGVQYNVEITSEQIFAWAPDSKHEIRIVAKDNRGLSSNRYYWFTAVEDYLSTAVFYLLRKNKESREFIPIAKMGTDTYSDYLTVGVNTYKVRAVDRYDNFYDSNEVEITVEVEHGQLALVSSPDIMFPVVCRRGGRPEFGTQRTYFFEEQYFEGREKPVHSYLGEISRQMDLSFTHISLEAYEQLNQMLRKGEKLIYRNLYQERLIGYALSNNSDPQGRMASPRKDAAIDFSIALKETDYKEAISYD